MTRQSSAAPRDLSRVQTNIGPGDIETRRAPEPALPFDAATIASLRELGDDDDTFVQEVLVAYVEQANEIAATMHASLDADDFQSLRRAAHALVGSSLNAGAVRVATISRAIEQSEDGTRAQLETALKTLDAELRYAAAAVSEKGWAGDRS